LLSDFESCSQSVDLLGGLKMARETAYAGNRDEERKYIGGEARDSLIKPILIQAQEHAQWRAGSLLCISSVLRYLFNGSPL
jgi:hypothetical protein